MTPTDISINRTFRAHGSATAAVRSKGTVQPRMGREKPRNPRQAAIVDDVPDDGPHTHSERLQTGSFNSVLSRPFHRWNDIETVLLHIMPELDHTQRGCIIRSLIRFLELKVVMSEYIPKDLLSPTNLVARAWGALILETKLYKRVTFTIQDFHGKPRHMIHHSVIRTCHPGTITERIERTQAMFRCYYSEQMPVSLDDIDASYTSDTSTLTGWVPTPQPSGYAACGLPSQWTTQTDDADQQTQASSRSRMSIDRPWTALVRGTFFDVHSPQHNDYTSTVTPEENSRSRNSAIDNDSDDDHGDGAIADNYCRIGFG